MACFQVTNLEEKKSLILINMVANLSPFLISSSTSSLLDLFAPQLFIKQQLLKFNSLVKEPY